jgi:molybdate transport system regulatory protein
MSKQPTPPGLRLRLVFADGAMLGPGKADLLAAIAETGSIAAAGRSMGMSYRRAWQLVELLNTMFAEPLVAASRGGAARGGARLTETGETVLARYRDMVAAAERATAAPVARLHALRPPAGTSDAER